MEPFSIVGHGKTERAWDNLASGTHRKPSAPRGIAYFARALGVRCPACGKGPAMNSWFSMHERCPRCGFALERDDGYRSGAMAANLVGTELAVTMLLLIGGVMTWPGVPWNWFSVVGIVAAVVFPLAFYPLSRTLWVALDLTFRPPEAADFGFVEGPVVLDKAA